MSYTGHSLGMCYLSAEMQLVYYTVQSTGQILFMFVLNTDGFEAMEASLLLLV